MAEAASTELALSNNLDGIDDSIDTRPTLMDQLGTTEMVRQITLVVTLVICIVIAIFVFLWSKEPSYRPLAQMPTQELIETLDFLDQGEIQYKLEGNTVYVVEINDPVAVSLYLTCYPTLLIRNPLIIQL